MNTVRKIGLSASLLLASGFANAADYDLSSFESNFAVTTGVAGLFTDVFNFTLDDNATGKLLFSAATEDVLSFDSVTFSGNGVSISGNRIIWDGFSLAAIEAPVNLVAGVYSITVTGNSLSVSSGYSVDSTLAVSPVPEPSSIALMLGGLGLVGFMVARRKKS